MYLKSEFLLILVTVGCTYFIIKINNINYFFNNRIKLKYDTYYDTDVVYFC